MPVTFTGPTAQVVPRDRDYLLNVPASLDPYPKSCLCLRLTELGSHIQTQAAREANTSAFYLGSKLCFPPRLKLGEKSPDKGILSLCSQEKQ